MVRIWIFLTDPDTDPWISNSELRILITVIRIMDKYFRITVPDHEAN
jgi:hypothetical protein